MIKQNESEVGCDMLPVSEVLLRFIIMQMSMLKPDTCRTYMFHVTEIKQIMLCKPEYCKVHKCLVSNSIEICFKVKNNLKQ